MEIANWRSSRGIGEECLKKKKKELIKVTIHLINMALIEMSIPTSKMIKFCAVKVSQ